MFSEESLLKRLEGIIENRKIVVDCLSDKKAKEINVNDLLRLEIAFAESELLMKLKQEILNGDFQE